jgi:carbonic anhydrase
MRWHLVLAVASVRTTGRLRTGGRQKAKDFAFDYSHHGEDWVQGSCASRERQSPIDFSEDHFNAPATGKLSFNYQLVSSGFEIANSGHSIVADFAGLGYGGVTYENSWYNLLNVNLHSESEHTFSGVHKPMELHMVHKRYDGDALLVIAVLVDAMPFVGQPGNATVDPREKDFNPTLQFFTQQTPPVLNQKVVSMASDVNQLDMNKLIDGGTYFEYAGSLTAPPCSELVTWFVRRDPIRASTGQYHLLKSALYEMTADYGNFRVAMPINGRPIAVRTAIREEPPPEPPVMNIPIGPNPRTDREFRAMKWAKDALEVATGATDYIKDLDQRLRKAALAHARALAPDLTDMISTPPPATPPPLGPSGPSASDIEATAAHMAQSISEAAGAAIADAKEQIAAEAKKAAAAAAEKTAQMIAELPAVAPALAVNTAAPTAPPASTSTNGTAHNGTLLELNVQSRPRSRRLL